MDNEGVGGSEKWGKHGERRRRGNNGRKGGGMTGNERKSGERWGGRGLRGVGRGRKEAGVLKYEGGERT